MRKWLIVGPVVALAVVGLLLVAGGTPSVRGALSLTPAEQSASRASGTALATDPIPLNMWIVGEAQGVIQGASEKQGRADSSDIYALDHKVMAPVSEDTGLPFGWRVHTPLSIVKEMDKSTPQLYQALATGERLQVTIKWYRMDPLTRQEAHYFTTSLADAYIVEVRPFVPMTFDPKWEAYGHMEEVVFSYRQITWTYEPEGTDFKDKWIGAETSGSK